MHLLIDDAPRPASLSGLERLSSVGGSLGFQVAGGLTDFRGLEA